MRSSETPAGSASSRRSLRVSSALVLAAAVWAAAAGCASAPSRIADAGTGRAAFRSRCQQCHALPRPEDHTPAEWRPILKKMGPRAGMNPALQADVAAFLEAESGK